MQTLLSMGRVQLPLRLTCADQVWRAGWFKSSAGLQVLGLASDSGSLAGAATVGGDGSGWIVFRGAAARGSQLILTSAQFEHPCKMETSLLNVSDDGLKQRVEVVDKIAERARTAYAASTMDRSAYRSLLMWLQDEESLVHAEAMMRNFSDLSVHSYWHRSRLKFPTLVESELSRL